TKDATFGLFELEGGAMWSMNICWALPKQWPAASYGLEIGIVGTQGVIDIEDTHRDVILASDFSQGKAYRPAGREDEVERYVDFLTSYPPGDVYDGDIWGPMREETRSWCQRIYSGRSTPHASARDGHRNLMLTMAMDLSAKRGETIQLPISADELMQGLTD
ncbi:MAG: gfo/Idh/MocA family oxidoreductase, partial [Rhizobiales bacterium]|nr:gfo/Idh/MocA family oxidoreductase [Hyphomicrobiales bacterium]